MTIGVVNNLTVQYPIWSLVTTVQCSPLCSVICAWGVHVTTSRDSRGSMSPHRGTQGGPCHHIAGHKGVHVTLITGHKGVHVTLIAGHKGVHVTLIAGHKGSMSPSSRDTRGSMSPHHGTQGDPHVTLVAGVPSPSCTPHVSTLYSLTPPLCTHTYTCCYFPDHPFNTRCIATVERQSLHR